MTINKYLSTIESKKQNKQAELKQTHRYRKQFDSCRMRGGMGKWVEKVKRVRSTNWLLQNSHRDIKYSIGNIVNNIVITMCQMGTRFIEMIS